MTTPALLQAPVAAPPLADAAPAAWPHLVPLQARLLNACCGLAPLTWAQAEAPSSSSSSSPSPWQLRFTPAAAGPTGVVLRLRAGPHNLALHLEDASVLGDVSELFDPALPSPLRLACVRHGLDAWWPAFERAAGAALGITAVEVDLPPRRDPAFCIGLALQHSATGALRRGALWLDDEAGALWLLGRLAGLPRETAADEALLISARLHLHSAQPLTVPLRALASAAVGDVLLLDAAGASAPVACRLVVATGVAGGVWQTWQGWLQAAKDEPRTLTIEHRVTEEHAMDLSSAELSGLDVEVSGIEDIEVPLDIELARLSLSVAQLRTLAPGSVLPLPANAAHTVATLHCQGRRIGTGTLVSVGDRLALRMTSVFGVGVDVGVDVNAALATEALQPTTATTSASAPAGEHA